MEVTEKSKTGEAGRKALITRAGTRASQLALIVRGAPARRDNVVVRHHNTTVRLSVE